MTCKNKVTQYVQSGWTTRAVEMRCGSTSVTGDTLLCDKCAYEARELYPQGWVSVPGDKCVHGTYVGDAGGPDYLCGKCEAGDR